ncbi:MAG: hypothetical protein WDA75_04700 [Candidatus Latescibacterota bacterium]|jgi:hypothetical protein
MTESRESTGFKEHLLRVGDGRGGWSLRSAEYRMITSRTDGYLMPYGVAQMENGEVILVAGMQEGSDYGCVAFLSPDGGSTWGEAIRTGAYGRPLTFGYLGAGSVVFGNELLGKPAEGDRQQRLYFSADYGRTWEARPYPLTTRDGRNAVTTEGRIFAEPTAGNTRLWHLLVHFPPSDWARTPFELYLRRSEDSSRTWADERRMDEWRYEAEYQGRTVVRGVSEGSLIRAQDGTLVAAVRTDMPPRYWDEPHDDSLEGLGISRSRDDGATWSPVQILFDAGRHHPTLHLLPSGVLVMTYIVRVDVRDGRLASYRRGCEAVLSRDHGETWDLAGRVVLDEFEYSENAKWFNGMTGHLGSTVLADGSLLTAYGNYHAKGIGLIRWRAE